MGCGPAQPGEVVALWLSGMGESPSHVRHLTKQALRDFLSAETQGKHGMLQRFLPPLGGHNALLRISRTPHHLGLECRRNWHATADNRVELAARLATFEGEVRHVGPAVLGTHLMEEAKVPYRYPYPYPFLALTPTPTLTLTLTLAAFPAQPYHQPQP